MDTQQIFDIQNRLASKIQAIRSRIETHREYIGGHETRTRQLLIDPLLRELGWDLEDPGQVHLEFKIESGRPDYALWSNGMVVAVIEAKTLGKNLENDPSQVIKYGIDRNIPDLRIFVKTDGDRWLIFPLKPVTEAPLNLSISKQDPFVGAQIIMRLLQRMLSDAVMNAKAQSGTASSSQKPHSDEDQAKKAAKPDDLGEGWLTFDEVEFKGRSPNLMMLPDGKQVPIRSWKAIWLTIAEWITERHTVDGEMLFGKNPNYMAIRTENVGFWTGFGEQLSNGLWVIGGTVNTRNISRCSRALLEHCGVDTNTVRFKFNNNP